eukprot:5131593-Amphidinium_carterae.2
MPKECATEPLLILLCHHETKACPARLDMCYMSTTTSYTQSSRFRKLADVSPRDCKESGLYGLACVFPSLGHQNTWTLVAF